MNRKSDSASIIGRLERHYEYVGSPILIVDDKIEKILASNSSCHQLTGYSADELKSKTFKDLFKAKDPRVEAMSSILVEADSADEIEELNIPIRKKSGRSIPVNINIKARQEQGQNFCVCSLSDLSKIRALEVERESMLREVTYASKLADIGRLAAGVAHEINNPLMIVQGHSDCLAKMVEAGKADEALIKNSIDSIVRSTKRMANIIRQMTRVSRSTDLSITSVSVLDVLDSVLLIMASQLEMHDVNVTIERERDLIISADEKQIEQIVSNLFSNAIHALENRSGDRRIVVTLKKSGSSVKISFWNNGPEIPPDVRDKLMTPFFTTKKVGKGTGLGLYVSQGIMRAHGGDLVCDNVEEGCSFTIQFPNEKIRPLFTRNISTALVVEDEPELSRYISETLKKRGLRVTEASNGIEALKVIQQRPDISLVVTDIRMPEMDGIEFIRNMNFAHPEIRIMVISGFVDSYSAELSALKVEARFSKPLDIEAFTKTLDGLLDRKIAS